MVEGYESNLGQLAQELAACELLYLNTVLKGIQIEYDALALGEEKNLAKVAEQIWYAASPLLYMAGLTNKVGGRMYRQIPCAAAYPGRGVELGRRIAHLPTKELRFLLELMCDLLKHNLIACEGDDCEARKLAKILAHHKTHGLEGHLRKAAAML